MTVVQTCGVAPKTVEMQYHDFVEWDKRVSGGKTVKIPYLKQIQEAQFRAGSKSLFFKSLHDDDVFEECDFLMKKTQRDIDSGSNIPQIRLNLSNFHQYIYLYGYKTRNLGFILHWWIY